MIDVCHQDKLLYEDRVPAGFPSPAADYIDKPIDLNELLIAHPAATYFVRVAGDSMIGTGIFDSSLLLVDSSIRPKHNDIIIACLGGEFTVKRYVTHPRFSIIYPKYVDWAIVNYKKWTNGVSSAKQWESLDTSIQEVLVDFVYQGFTKGPKPMLAGSNDSKQELIDHIKNTPAISQYESGRHRVDYLEGR